MEGADHLNILNTNLTSTYTLQDLLFYMVWIG